MLSFKELMESTELTEDLKISPRCKKVIQAFVDKKSDDCKKLESDGEQLDGLWMGGKKIAFWKGNKIHIGPIGGRSGQTVARAVRKMANPIDMAEGGGEIRIDKGDEILEGKKRVTVTISLGGMKGHDVEIAADPSKPAQFVAILKKAVQSKFGPKKFKIQQIRDLDPKEASKIKKMTEAFDAEYICEKKPSKGTLYVVNSSIFDNPANKYDIELFSKTLKDAGAKKVWTDNAFGWSNQPEVVLFTGLNAKKAEKALDELPVFKGKGSIVADAHMRWD